MTQPYCRVCHPGAIEQRWTSERVLDTTTTGPTGGPRPSSYGWPRAHAGSGGEEALAPLAEGEWPARGIVIRLFGTWRAARTVASD